MNLKEKAKILDKESIDKSLKRMAHEIIENVKTMDDTVLIGIKNRGAYLADRLADKIKEIVGGSFVRSYGGKVKSIPFVKGYSTTSIIERGLRRH